ncbi:nitronate monooxygenase family protein [Porphyromonas sp. COT-290 OH3588]|uniref:NAD(P)H-dependent flavin oxidoreductase n=1 Tax=Porphyromonas sp. COT-290 OH3588 TaxID=1515617 RepID=UPI00052D053A|nr:nitronate monooxygenase [Porphyromonas sp. COT-290 OH3588]KGO01044.1 2-nitropropane dioxygenase [Porphyromonas sp. COT-290 OH3588]
MANRLCQLLGIRYPIISGGMVWCSGWKLASAVSREGGLGLIGAGSMHPDNLREHIRKCKAATDKPFGVNVPMLYPELDAIIDIIIEEQVPVVVTSAGNPKTYTAKLKAAGCKVLHVVASTKFALKSQEAGVDAVIAEGFEAGGHNGRDETTTMCLIPAVARAVTIPVVAAGGISQGDSVAAALALGADGVQIGTRFAMTTESSASEEFKRLCRATGEGGTMLSLKSISPTRLLKNDFYEQVARAEAAGATVEALRELQGKGRAKRGIFEGDLTEGMLEIGQSVALTQQEESVADVFRELISGYQAASSRLTPEL